MRNKTYFEKKRQQEVNSQLHKAMINRLLEKFKQKEISRVDFYELKTSVDKKYGCCASTVKYILV